jgi:hypothetical protein
MDAHGYLKFKWVADILYVHAFGPFNEEGVAKATSEYIALISVKDSSSYSIIEVWDTESLGSPKVMSEVSKMWAFLLKNNCTFIAIVVSNSLQKAVCEKLLPSKGKVFLNIEDAENWINK